MSTTANWNLVYIGSHSSAIHSSKLKGSLSSESKAIFIEPVPELIKNLILNCEEYYPKNQFVFLNVAVSNKDGTLTLYVPDVEIFSQKNEPWYIKNELPKWLDQLSSVHKTHLADHCFSHIQTKPFEAKCISLNTLIKDYNIQTLDTLYVDTEGHDFDILWDLNLDILKPKRIIFEHKHIEGSNKQLGQKYKLLLTKLFLYNYNIVCVDSEDTELILQDK